MKKIVTLLLGAVIHLHAAQTEPFVYLPPETRAYIELQQKLMFVASEVAEACNLPTKTPDLFGLTQDECVLREARLCCEEEAAYDEFLNLVTDPQVKRALVINFLGALYKDQADLETIMSHAKKYKPWIKDMQNVWWIINGQDMRAWNKRLKLHSTRGKARATFSEQDY